MNFSIFIFGIAILGVVAACIHYFRQPKSLKKNKKTLFKAKNKDEVRNEMKWEFVFFGLLILFLIVLEKCSK